MSDSLWVVTHPALVLSQHHVDMLVFLAMLVAALFAVAIMRISRRVP